MVKKALAQKGRSLLLLGLWQMLSAAVFASTPQSSDLAVTFLNVGYGDCILIQTREGRNLLIDAGDPGPAPRLLDRLWERNISEIHTAFITHPHKNHFGGFLTLSRHLKIHRLFINGDMRVEPPYRELEKQLAEKEIPVEILRQGTTLTFSGGTKIEILHAGDESMDINDASMVMRLVFGKTTFLFTSDVGPEIQVRLAKRAGGQLRANVIQIPHHGGPLHPDFMKHFQADIFVISTGPNPYGLPREEEIRDFKERLLRTDHDGDIAFESDGEMVRFAQYPSDKKRPATLSNGSGSVDGDRVRLI
jgi:competence protein ComEC